MGWTCTSLTMQHHGRTEAVFHTDASMVTTAPLMTSMSSSFGMAVISLDLSATFTWPSTRYCLALIVPEARLRRDNASAAFTAARLPAMTVIIPANQEDHHRFSIPSVCHLQIHRIALGRQRL